MKIPIIYIEEDNTHYFEWIFGPIWEKQYTRISKRKWHVSVF